jgi:hypothetical protein
MNWKEFFKPTGQKITFTVSLMTLFLTFYNMMREILQASYDTVSSFLAVFLTFIVIVIATYYFGACAIAYGFTKRGKK